MSIDYVLMSKSVISNVGKANMQTTLWMDHAAVTCHLHSSEQIQRKKRWVLNNSILFHDINRDKIEMEIQNYFKTNNNCEVSEPEV